MEVGWPTRAVRRARCRTPGWIEQNAWIGHGDRSRGARRGWREQKLSVYCIQYTRNASLPHLSAHCGSLPSIDLHMAQTDVRLLVTGIALAVGVACAAEKRREIAGNTATSVGLQSPSATSGMVSGPLSGRWLTNGYGQLLEIAGDSLVRSEITDISCLRTLTARRQAGTASDDSVLFVSTSTNGDLGVQDAFHIVRASSADRRWLTAEGAISRTELQRTSTLPATCSAPADSSPVGTFDVFWQTWNEHYPFFALKQTDWRALRDANRPKVSASTSPRQLLSVFRAMIEPLHDAHTFIDARSIRSGFGGGRMPPSDYARHADRAIDGIIASRFQRGRLHSFVNRQIEFAMLADSIAYMRIRSFSEYAKDPRFSVQVATLEAALDTMFRESAAWRGLVIDVRRNGGGSDVFGTIIAGRMTDSSYLAYNKVIRNSRIDAASRTAPQPAMVTPSATPRFRGAVVLLTGIESVSAAETFAMALMGRTPRVTRIGENTQGVFSDVLVRRLPNGWGFGLPNEIYLSANGVAYDGAGVPPDIEVPVFRTADLAAMRDPALKRAISEISGSSVTSAPATTRK